jgi:hypothetical protein
MPVADFWPDCEMLAQIQANSFAYPSIINVTLLSLAELAAAERVRSVMTELYGTNKKIFKQ